MERISADRQALAPRLEWLAKTLLSSPTTLKLEFRLGRLFRNKAVCRTGDEPAGQLV